MKKLILSLVLAGMASITALLPTSLSAQGAVNWFTPGAWSGPTFGLMSSADINAVSYALMNYSSMVNGVPFIPNGSTVPVTTALSIGDEGRVLYSPFAVTSSVPFTLADIAYTMSYRNGAIVRSGTFGGDNVSFTMFGIGIGTEGQIYTSGNATTPIVAAFGIGYGYGNNYTGRTMSQALTLVNSRIPDTLIVNYTLNSIGTGNMTTYIVAVPEPNGLLLAFAGVSGLILLRFKTKK